MVLCPSMDFVRLDVILSVVEVCYEFGVAEVECGQDSHSSVTDPGYSMSWGRNHSVRQGGIIAIFARILDRRRRDRVEKVHETGSAFNMRKLEFESSGSAPPLPVWSILVRERVDLEIT